jgi:NDP-sugar pyrophosphorylase family protein
MPANPLHVFGGDLWGRKEVLRRFSLQFLEHKYSQKQSLEHDFFFWLINRGQVKSVMLNGEWIHVDSARDVRTLLNHLSN